MQHLSGLRARWTQSTGRGVCRQRQAQPVRDLQTPSLNLATWKSGKAGMKPCSLDPAPPPAALRGCPRYPGLPQAPAQAAQGGPGCFADRLLCAPPPATTSLFNFHFEHRIIHFLAGLLWSSSLWQPKAWQTFICTTAGWVPEKLFSSLCSWKLEPRSSATTNQRS